MATKAKSRIRWTAEEMALVVTAAQELQAKGARLNSEQRLAKSQAGLPKSRRRPYSANLGSWLSKAVRGEVGVGAAAKGARTIQSGKKSVFAAPSESTTALLTQALIASGAAILKGILLDPGVQKALKQALR